MIGLVVLGTACSSSAPHQKELHPGGAGGNSGAGGSVGSGGSACPDIFAPTLQTYSLDIGATDWAAIQSEFLTAGALVDQAFVAYQPVEYPVVFHYGGDTAEATIRLRGDSSWREAAAIDGANGKMQLSIAFDSANPDASFHGIGKIKLDMPRTDHTFMRERVANNWLRSVGIAAGCTTSAQLMVNGSVYGVFVAEEHFGHRVLGQFFPGNDNGDLFDGGWTPQTNKLNPNTNRLAMFWDATTPAALSAIVDVPQSVTSWAAEALLNDADGYWGGDHNFYLYDQGAKGYVFIPHDLDSTLDYLGRFDSDPITWWSVRPDWMLPIPQQYLIVMGDDTLRAMYIEALRAELARFDVTSLQAAIDASADQIRAAVAADPHRPTDMTMQDFEDAVKLARDGIKERADYVTRWLMCKDSHVNDDGDGDGYSWCNDCRDDLPSVHPGAAEICGNGFDDNCNGVVDDGCAAP